MSAVNLTISTALANAQTALNDRTQCLNENFQLDRNLTHKATFEQLIAKINSFNIPDSNKEKRRLLVIIRMTNPPIEQPKNFEELKAAIVKKFSTPKPPSPVEMALQKQKELSLLLAAFEFMQIEKIERVSMIKANEKLQKLKVDLPDGAYNDPVLFPLLILHFQCSLRKNPETGKIEFMSNFRDKHPSFYVKIKKFLSHPNPYIRKIAEHEFKFREIVNLSYAETISSIMKDCFQFALDTLYYDDSNREILQKMFPDLIKLMECVNEGYIKINAGIADPTLYIQRALFNTEQLEAFFHKKYQEVFAELQALQEKHFPKKEAFEKRFGNRLLDTYFPKSVKAKTFPLPGKIPRIDKVIKLPKEEEPVVQVKAEKPKKKKKAAKPILALQEKREEPKVIVDSSSFIKGVLAERSFPFDEVDYDKRVLDWFSKREAAPIKFTPEDAVWKHAFSRIVDRFLGTPYCFRDTWKNETTGNDDPCFCILADITLPSRETIPGVFQFTFDKNWKCYHRWFGPMSNIERLDKVISQKRDKIDFPPLRKPEKPKLEELDRTKFEIDPYFDSITFKDEQNNLIIKIYRVEE